ncbi:MAG: phosphatidate cytidylyltransferase [Acholeplasmataceae bacterium]|nr:phosphatidate cytidylyltransferase [Acholeplasmataceae bacterium]
MRQRTITALVMAAVCLPILVFGDHYYIFAVFCGLLSIGATIEIMMVARQKTHLSAILMVAYPLVTAMIYVLSYLSFGRVIEGTMIAVYFGLAVLLLMTINLWLPKGLIKPKVYLLMTSLYVGVTFAALASIREIGLIPIIYMLLTAMFTDTFAYFIGVKYGKHRLAEKISPKKTIEGAIAGLVIGSALGSVFAIFFKLFSMHWALVVLLTLSLSVFSQIGDLVESKIKRDYDIKDFSNLLPGHGGILDRVDSWVFTSLGLVVIVEIFDIVFLV